MQRLKFLALSIAVLALVALPSITSSQNERPRRPQARFVKMPNAIPNRYIVVLNDDVADDDSPREVRWNA